MKIKNQDIMKNKAMKPDERPVKKGSKSIFSKTALTGMIATALMFGGGAATAHGSSVNSNHNNQNNNNANTIKINNKSNTTQSSKVAQELRKPASVNNTSNSSNENNNLKISKPTTKSNASTDNNKPATVNNAVNRVKNSHKVHKDIIKKDNSSKPKISDFPKAKRLKANVSSVKVKKSIIHDNVTHDMDTNHKGKTEEPKHINFLEYSKSPKWYIDHLSRRNFHARDWIVTHESGHHWKILSYGHRCIGYFQLDPAYLGKRHGHINLNHKHQVRVADKYAKTRYGSWVRAKAWWAIHHWY